MRSIVLDRVRNSYWPDVTFQSKPLTVHRKMQDQVARMHVFAFDVEMTFISGGNTWYNA